MAAGQGNLPRCLCTNFRLNLSPMSCIIFRLLPAGDHNTRSMLLELVYLLMLPKLGEEMVTCLAEQTPYQVSHPLRNTAVHLGICVSAHSCFSASHFADPKAKPSMKEPIVFRCLAGFDAGEMRPEVLSHFRPCPFAKCCPSEKPFISHRSV